MAKCGKDPRMRNTFKDLMTFRMRLSPEHFSESLLITFRKMMFAEWANTRAGWAGYFKTKRTHMHENLWVFENAHLYWQFQEVSVERYDKKGCLIAWLLDVSRWGRWPAIYKDVLLYLETGNRPSRTAESSSAEHDTWIPTVSTLSETVCAASCYGLRPKQASCALMPRTVARNWYFFTVCVGNWWWQEALRGHEKTWLTN